MLTFLISETFTINPFYHKSIHFTVYTCSIQYKLIAIACCTKWVTFCGSAVIIIRIQLIKYNNTICLFPSNCISDYC